MNKTDEQISDKNLGTVMAPLGDLIPHPLNANVMTDDLREKLKVNIKNTGRYPFLVVRPHPLKKSKYEILDSVA